MYGLGDDDTLDASAVTAVPVELIGGAGNDTLSGGSQDDLLLGNSPGDYALGASGDTGNDGDGFVCDNANVFTEFAHEWVAWYKTMYKTYKTMW